MRRSPSIIPDVDDRDVYLVLDDFGRLGRSWRETDGEASDRATIIRALLEGQYNAPVRVVAFNTAEGWSRDVSEDIAEELALAYTKDGRDIPAALEDFIDQHRMPWPELLAPAPPPGLARRSMEMLTGVIAWARSLREAAPERSLSSHMHRTCRA